MRREHILHASMHVDEEGQSTLEYAAVLLGIIAIVVALGALFRLGSNGTLAYWANQAASHAIGVEDMAGALLDIFMY